MARNAARMVDMVTLGAAGFDDAIGNSVVVMGGKRWSGPGVFRRDDLNTLDYIGTEFEGQESFVNFFERKKKTEDEKAGIMGVIRIGPSAGRDDEGWVEG